MKRLSLFFFLMSLLCSSCPRIPLGFDSEMNIQGPDGNRILQDSRLTVTYSSKIPFIIQNEGTLNMTALVKENSTYGSGNYVLKNNEHFLIKPGQAATFYISKLSIGTIKITVQSTDLDSQSTQFYVD